MKREERKGFGVGLLVSLMVVAAVVCVAARYEDFHVTLLRVGDPAIQVSGSASSLLEQLNAGTYTNSSANLTLGSNTVLIGNASGLAVAQTLSGDVTSGTNGALTIASIGAVDGSSLTNLSAANLTVGGVASAIDGGSITNLSGVNMPNIAQINSSTGVLNVTTLTPAYAGQPLVWSTSNKVWISEDTTTNGWIALN